MREIFLFAVAMFLPLEFAEAQANLLKALVLYDAPQGERFGKLGMAYAIEMRNLLGHFHSQVDLLPVESYTNGMLENYQATFYIGSYYDNPLPKVFLADVAGTLKTVVWFKYNLWQLAWDPLYNFSAKRGLGFVRLRGMNATPSVDNPAPGFFDTVSYKGKELVKQYAFSPVNGEISGDPDLGVTKIIDTSKATTLVNITNSKTAEVAPYIVQSGNFWYVGDIPFSYMGPRDRYLVLCDIVHDMVGVDHAPNRRALVRLEDVNAITSQAAMKALTDFLDSKHIPFTVAVIPHYIDPLGRYSGGVPKDIPLSQATTLKASLDYALAHGGKIVMHGYTHQHGVKANRRTGVSGDDFEFWDAVNNQPVAEDSISWARNRLEAGIAEFAASGFTPIAWEAPHYRSSPMSMKAVPALFSTTYQRVVYYTSDNPSLDIDEGGRDFAAGQFFPYVIESDYYGQRILPENLGNIGYDVQTMDRTANFNYTAQDLCANASYAMVVRDSFASFFFHPYWLQPELKLPAMTDFQTVITCVTEAGFTWVDASAVQ